MMRFIVLVLTVAALFLWERNSDRPSAGKTRATASTGTQVSGADWPKRSIDRARAVAGQVQTMREQDPGR